MPFMTNGNAIIIESQRIKLGTHKEKNAELKIAHNATQRGRRWQKKMESKSNKLVWRWIGPNAQLCWLANLFIQNPGHKFFIL